jgi:hypothetical protein
MELVTGLMADMKLAPAAKPARASNPATGSQSAIFLARINFLNFHSALGDDYARVYEDAEKRLYQDALRIAMKLELDCEECVVMQPLVYEFDTTTHDGKKLAQRARHLFVHTVRVWDEEAAQKYGGDRLIFGLDVSVHDTTTPKKKKKKRLAYRVMVDFVAPQKVTSEPERTDDGAQVILHYPKDKYAYIVDEVRDQWVSYNEQLERDGPARGRPGERT